jgi:hypothetical protein
MEKLQRVKDYTNIFRIFGLAQFVGVSGSIAAGTVSETDDLDVFIVVRDYTAWLYRGIVSIFLLVKGVLRTMRNKDVNNKFCINLIVEERGIRSFDKDIFIMHELMYLIPVVNESYKNFIICSNEWLADFGVNIKKFCADTDMTDREVKQNTPFAIRLINNLIFFIQYLFMMLRAKDKYLVARKIDTYMKRGYIYSYIDSFKKNILSSLDK